MGLWLGGHLDQLDALNSAETEATASAAADVFQTAVAARDKIADGLADLEVSKSLGDIQHAVFQRAKDKLTAQLAAAEQQVKEAVSALEAPEADTALLREAQEGPGWNADQRAALRGGLDRGEVGKDTLTVFPVTGEVMELPRAGLHPRCKVSGCDRREATRGLCKSHSMRARNLGVLDALAARVAEDNSPSVTVAEVEEVFTRANGL